MKKKAILLVGYHYLSTPIYLALKEQLTQFELFYVFTKDSIGSDTNFRHFDRATLSRTDTHFVELGYDPPWFTGLMTWHLRSKWQKLRLWIRWVFAFSRFKKELLSLVRRLNPDVIITTSDMFFSPRYLAAALPAVPMVVIQPCYLDLWERPRTFSALRTTVNLFQPGVFERQQYFGLEIERASLLVWEPALRDIYGSKGREVIEIVSPTHIALREAAVEDRARHRESILRQFGLDAHKPVISFFPAFYGDVKGHGLEYQRQLEEALIAVLKNVDTRYSVMIKVHPNEDLGYWQRVFSGVLNDRIQLIQNCERFKLMAVSDFFISTNSYSAVEATLSGCVSINFVPGIDIIGEDFCAPFSKHSVITCTSVEGLLDVLSQQGDAPAIYREMIAETQARILGESGGRRTVEDVLVRAVSPVASGSVAANE